MSKSLNFQQVILKLHDFWSARNCLIWSPYNVQVGAGTGNPATTLRVLGPEPWHVAYVEPSVRPDDGRFGENPNRMQKYFQYQVILKPDPGNPQELYLDSLEALGINPRQHDIRFVEDNWESPALGAWGLGWEVWLDGQEITQFTYFQQAGGMSLDPVSVEITYGIERITLALQGVESAWDIDWLDGVNYGDVMFNDEVDHCRYYFDVADVNALKAVYDTYEREYARALEGDALISAYDYVLKCSHLFNVLDTRGAIGVTERAGYFRRMRDMTREVAKTYVAQRERLGHPLMKMADKWRAPAEPKLAPLPEAPTEAADVLIEIGVEELPADDVAAALRQMQELAPKLFDELRLPYSRLETHATPRRIVIIAHQVAPRQTDEEFVAKGPPAARAFDADGNPTRAALGFARSKGVDVRDLVVQDIDGGKYVTAMVRTPGRNATEALAERLPAFIADLKFGRVMRWNASGHAFSRPIRWIVALFGDQVIPFEFAGVASGRVSRGLRPFGSIETTLASANAYDCFRSEDGIIINADERKASIKRQIESLAAGVGGTIPPDAALLDEVCNLVEAPTAFLGAFDAQFLSLPREVLVTVMRKHQRYFAVEDESGELLNVFIGVRNGDAEYLDKVIQGNEHVLRARFSDASFFFQSDIKTPLADFLPRLDTLTFQAQLGSMRAKNDRVAATIDDLGAIFGFAADDIAIARQAAQIAKADLATSMVVEMTSLQGIMGREYALREGVDPAVANAIAEHWLPAGAGDQLPESAAGKLLALADKLDSLVGLLAVGLAPKSTSDPFGLRRAALGVIRILDAAGISVDLRVAIKRVAAGQPVPVDAESQRLALRFLGGRLENWLAENFSFRSDVIRAVLSAQAHNPHRAVQGIRELGSWVDRDDWESILDSFSRCVRITRSEAPQQLNPDLASETSEIALHEALLDASSSLNEESGVDAFLSAFEAMTPAVTTFFDEVLVHADDARIRTNRIALLQRICQLQYRRADLSQLDNF